VEKGRQPKTQFSDVYREFEKLHSQVKKMAQDYISNPQGVHMALEVHNVEVKMNTEYFPASTYFADNYFEGKCTSLQL
jgi:hypothetical protein